MRNLKRRDICWLGCSSSLDASLQPGSSRKKKDLGKEIFISQDESYGRCHHEGDISLEPWSIVRVLKSATSANWRRCDDIDLQNKLKKQLRCNH